MGAHEGQAGGSGFLLQAPLHNSQFHKFKNTGMPAAKDSAMPTLIDRDNAHEPASSARPAPVAAEKTACYSIAVFTQRWRDIREFYVSLLGARVLSEKPEVFCELELGGVPLCLRQSQHGEAVSYFHLYLALADREAVLRELRRRGIVVTTVGPYTNFRDPEGRVIKLSDAPTVVG